MLFIACLLTLADCDLKYIILVVLYVNHDRRKPLIYEEFGRLPCPLSHSVLTMLLFIHNRKWRLWFEFLPVYCARHLTTNLNSKSELQDTFVFGLFNDDCSSSGYNVPMAWWFMNHGLKGAYLQSSLEFLWINCILLALFQKHYFKENSWCDKIRGVKADKCEENVSISK
jgi:hypothetical protein